MDLLTLQERARTLPREQFVASTPGLYLAVTARSQKTPISFRTTALDQEARAPQLDLADLEIVPLAKAPENPYPDRISIGRARNCDVVLRFPSVSKLHAHLRRLDRGRAELVDLGSQNGTSVNGRRLAPNDPQRVVCGDILLFGAITAQIVDADRLFDAFHRG